MPSVWLGTRRTRGGEIRHRVYYRLDYPESPKYGGSFKTLREARLRKAYIAGELAAKRVPDLKFEQPKRAPTLAEAAARWRESRVDVSEGTRVVHRVSLDRVLPFLGARRVDSLTVDDLNGVIVALAEKGKKRSTIRKSIKYLAAVLDECGLSENVARDKRIRLPHERQADKETPLAEHVEAVVRLLAPAYRLPLIWLDWSGARVASVETLRIGDHDEPGRRLRLRTETQKTAKPLWVPLHPVLAEAIQAKLPPREDRDPEAPLFPGTTADRLRTAIARACRAAGVPVFSPHALRDRRVSLLHEAGWSTARIAAYVGHEKLSTTLDVYTHVLSDGREADYTELLAA